MGLRKLEQEDLVQQRTYHILPSSNEGVMATGTLRRHDHSEELRNHWHTARNKPSLAVYYEHNVYIKNKFSTDPSYLTHFKLFQIAYQFSSLLSHLFNMSVLTLIHLKLTALSIHYIEFMLLDWLDEIKVHSLTIYLQLFIPASDREFP